MEIRKDKNSGSFVIRVGTDENPSTILIPSDLDIDEKVIVLTLAKISGGVPINQVRVSLKECLSLIDQIFRELEKAGLQPKLIRQLLPRGVG